MSKREVNPDRINGWIWALAGGLFVTALVAGGATGGNEHGSSKTNLDTMPNYPVAPMQPQVTEAAPALPDTSRKTGMAVCSTSVFLDFQRKEVIIRPVLNEPGSGRPLHLNSVNAAGASFAQPLPRDNFSVLNTDGTQDNNQRLDECSTQQVEPHSVRHDGKTEYVLTSAGEGIDDGDKVPAGAIGAVCSGLIHYQIEFPSTGTMDVFVQQLEDANC